MQNTQTTETLQPVVFDTKLEVIPGGITVAVADLSQTQIKAGTPVGKDGNGLYHVIKTVVINADATSSATSYQIKKGSDVKVGDFLSLGVGKVSKDITAIDTSNADYDTVTVSATLGTAVTAGDVLVAALSASSTSALKYTPAGLVGTTIDVVSGDNHLVDCVVRGSVRAGVAPSVNSDIKTALPLIRWVS